jgi:hypothetical protein
VVRRVRQRNAPHPVAACGAAAALPFGILKVAQRDPVDLVIMKDALPYRVSNPS